MISEAFCKEGEKKMFRKSQEKMLTEYKVGVKNPS